MDDDQVELIELDIEYANARITGTATAVHTFGTQNLAMDENNKVHYTTGGMYIDVAEAEIEIQGEPPERLESYSRYALLPDGLYKRL